jgi:hypothetical protein
MELTAKGAPVYELATLVDSDRNPVSGVSPMEQLGRFKEQLDSAKFTILKTWRGY